MKKFLSTIILISCFSLGVAAQEMVSTESDNHRLTLSGKAAPIEDDLIKEDMFPLVMPEYVKENEPITDDIVVPYAQSDNMLRIWVRKRGEYHPIDIDDELITPNFVSKSGKISVLKRRQKTRIEDNFAKNHISLEGHRKIKVKNIYDFTKAQIPVQLKIIKKLTTKNHISEGDSILFKTTKEVSLDGIVLPKGTEVIGRVETISASDKMGTPANIVVDNFYVKDHPDICLYGNVAKTGANRSIWVYPLYQAGNIMFYVAGFVFVPIHGGHAKLLTSDTYTVFYETH